MKSGIWSSIVRLILLGVLAMPILVAAQDAAKPNNARHHHYKVVDIGTFGGPNSSYLQGFPEGRMLNNSGAAVGAGDTTTPDPLCVAFDFDCYVAFGFKWQNGVANPLRALPGFDGLNSATGNWISDSGLTVGLSENGIDPLTGGPAVEAVLWGKDNSLTDLGTLGGNASSANAVNSRGQVAGEALNTILDLYTSDFSNFLIGGVTQVHAFSWTQFRGMQDLGTLGGTDSAAFSINERGQIAGWSFTNTTPNPVVDSCSGLTMNVPTEDPFLWENGKMIDLGSLGGTCGQAWAINNRGQVVGFSDLPGDAGDHAFLWDHTGGMQDLGTLGGDTGGAAAINDAGDIVGGDSRSDGSGGSFLWSHGVMTDLGTVGTAAGSVALGINSRGQIVGTLFDNTGNEAGGFLWENGGPMIDLSTLIPPNPDLQVDHVFQINDHGEITARGTFSNGNTHSLVLIPCDENHPDIAGCDYSLADASSLAPNAMPRFLPNANQHPHQPWRMNRFHIPGRAVVGGAGGSATQVSPVSDFTPPPPVFYVSATLLTPSSVNPGGSSTSTVTAYFGTNPVTTAALSCSVQPSPPLGATCSINPTSAAPATLRVSTFGPSGRLLSGSGLLYALWLPLIGLVATGSGLGARQNGQKRTLKAAALVCALFAGLTLQVACGGGSHSSGTPAGTYTITVTATAFVPVNTSVTTVALTVQ
jgi:probable HAF family extracellular repeat protein